MSTDNLQPATPNSFVIREATPDDVPEMLAFIRELAEYERSPESAIATAEDLLRDGFGPHPVFRCLIAEISDPAAKQPATSNLQPATVVAAMALYFPFYSTWRGNAGVHLEDLFVRPQFRRRGIAQALFARLAQITLARGDRFQWHVLDWNQPAIDFYEQMRAHMLHEWRIMRIDGDALKTLAAKAPPQP
jgi:GNAT superfamily N-acetyltransferase